jgi:hypothetical protein
MLTVLTWLWKQPLSRAVYTAHHVNIWADMVRRNLSMPHRIACVTDLPEGIDPAVEILPPPGEFVDWRIPSWGPRRPQCLRRIAMFAPDAGKRFGERFVCMDLDCIVTGPLDPLFADDVEFRICKGTAHGRLYNGSMMLLKAGSRAQVYERFTLDEAVKAGRRFVGSDQAWISHCLGAGEATWGPEHGVQWHGQPVRDPRVVFFPGATKPWQLVDAGGPLAKHYRRSTRGRALVLGHAPHVWSDLERALPQGFDAVIASPEAAAHWPGGLLAVADDDAHAERIALMHGFEDIVFCGRTNEGGRSDAR